MTIDQIEVFFGEANNAEARIYARLADARNLHDCRLTGRVIGPACEYAHTLSATIPVVSKRPAAAGSQDAPALLAEAVVPDPCFWSTDLPFLYKVALELRRGTELLATLDRLLGIRPLGAVGRRLVFEGRTWVPRGVDCGELPESELGPWRTADLVMVVERPSDELCRQASRLGVVLVAEIAGSPVEIAAEVRRCSRWPAVATAILCPSTRLAATIRATATNLLLAQSFGPGSAIEPAEWADVVVCEVADAADLGRRAATCKLPMIARRPCGWRDELVQARGECDLLQRDLAAQGDFAGYLV